MVSKIDEYNNYLIKNLIKPNLKDYIVKMHEISNEKVNIEFIDSFINSINLENNIYTDDSKFSELGIIAKDFKIFKYYKFIKECNDNYNKYNSLYLQYKKICIWEADKVSRTVYPFEKMKYIQNDINNTCYAYRRQLDLSIKIKTENINESSLSNCLNDIDKYEKKRERIINGYNNIYIELERIENEFKNED